MRNPAQLIVPPRLRVGFNERSDTYTGKLAFVTYRDAQGALHQEKAWDKWRKHHIEPVEHPNDPTEGFVLNKNVGGARGSWSHFARDEHIRVYDPRGWEFEITVPNLLYLLQEGTCYPGKELGGKFLYAWDKNRVVLLPASSADCATSLVFTSLQDKHIDPADLVPGRTYLTKTQEHWVYVGRVSYHFALGTFRCTKRDRGIAKKHAFGRLGEKGWEIVYKNDAGALAVQSSAALADNYAELVDLHYKSFRGSKVARLFLRPAKEFSRSYKDCCGWHLELREGVFAEVRTEYDGEKPKYTSLQAVYEVRRGIVHSLAARGAVGAENNSIYAYHPDYQETRYIHHPTSCQSTPIQITPLSPRPWLDPEPNELCALLENGAEVVLSYEVMKKEQP